jgi:hypothetical protein
MDQLDECWAIISAHVRELNGDQLSVDMPFYWTLPVDEMSDFTSRPTPTIGDLDFALEILRNLTIDPKFVLSHDLVFLGDVLRAVGVAAAEVPAEKLTH